MYKQIIQDQLSQPRVVAIAYIAACNLRRQILKQKQRKTVSFRSLSGILKIQSAQIL